MKVIFPCKIEQIAPNVVEIDVTRGGDLPFPELEFANWSELDKKWNLSPELGDEIHEAAFNAAMGALLKGKMFIK